MGWLLEAARIQTAERQGNADLGVPSGVLEQMREKQKWLADAHRHLMALPEVGRRTPLEAQFLAAIHEWDTMDEQLRRISLFEGCVWGPGRRCLDESPITCRGCAHG